MLPHMASNHPAKRILLVLSLAWACVPVNAQPKAIDAGTGSYASDLHSGAKAPPRMIYRTEDCTWPMPTNDWWSSLAWLPFSERQYPHPLAVEATSRGLRIWWPAGNISANKDAIFAFMPGGGGDDLILNHSNATAFADARVAAFSDWFVTAQFAQDKHILRVTYGHGSPFVYATFTAGTARIITTQPAKVWAGDAKSSTLGITVNGKHYALFGPTGSTWAGIDTKSLTNETDKQYFSLAVLPKANPKTLELFQRFAHSHVTDSTVSWKYDAATSSVTTTFDLTTKAHEGSETGSLMALYPHQWHHTSSKMLDSEYPSVRGKMKLLQGDSFQTVVKFPGVLPALPRTIGADQNKIIALLAKDAAATAGNVRDTYWEGKHLGKLAALIPIAEQHGQMDHANALRDIVQKRLEFWLTAAAADGKMKTQGLFAYDPLWTTLIGYPASFGSDVELNDHHFHYGYFLKAAAEIARHDPQWASDARFGAMLKLLIRDIASPDRSDKLFPFLRNFDPYAGHSWASGHSKFGDGNNNESSSEAMNAWAGIILLGEAIDDTAMRDLGIWLFTTEMTAIHEYWFDLRDENHPPSYTPTVVTMIWGGKGANGTWFTANPEAVHGINFLPIHGGSLYLGHDPQYLDKNYQGMAKTNGSEAWDEWCDILWMYRALSDPTDAMRQFDAATATTKLEGGNSLTNTYHWIASLRDLGQVDASVNADDPIYAVFRKGELKTYVVYAMRDKPRVVTFSDGFRLRIEKRGWAVETAK